MDESIRQELREHLQARRKELIEQGRLRAEPNRDDPSTQPDEDTQPLTEMNQVIASRRNKVRAQELTGIEQALRRMDEEPEEYGRCIDCDEFIPLGRLKLMPWAQRCVQCQSAHGDDTGRGYRRRHVRDFVE